VSKTKDLPFGNNTFDTIISSECFEHDPEYKESFIKIYNMLKPDGLFCFTCASTGRNEHGTRRTLQMILMELLVIYQICQIIIKILQK
jgi:cyclopropane fatty-acyl-phospholipid synthase-like methyltransferase